MRTRIKICGVTRLECLRQAIHLGADAIGFNMYSESPRYLDIESAGKLVPQVPAFVTTIGLVVNENPDLVEAKSSELGFDLLQFHGDENNAFCRQFGRPFVKVLRIKDAQDLEQVKDFPDARGFLFDAHVEGMYGGTGKRIDPALLSRFPEESILAGGLHPDNVEEAIVSLRPFAVDVSSGVETEVGIKDPQLLAKFFQAVQTADRRS